MVDKQKISLGIDVGFGDVKVSAYAWDGNKFKTKQLNSCLCVLGVLCVGVGPQ